MWRHWALASALITTPMIALVALLANAQSGPAPSTKPRDRPAEKLQSVGSASCASAACHHGNGPQGAVGSEYTTWSLHDPHALAWRVLLDERSQQITANLGATEPASKNPQCLNCHVQPHIQTIRQGPRFSLKEGVGCEACHGPAERWLTEHSRPDWKHRKADDRTALGWRHTEDLPTRAELCAGCHVGRSGMEVTHDLIAAGHPPLRFEFAAYHANLPKHWREKEDAHGDFEARAWQIGQLASAQASVDCLHNRAENGPWPELADFDCFACHHDLQPASWRRNHTAKSGVTLRPGSPTMNRWYLATIDEILLDESNTLDRLGVLRKQFTFIAPDRRQVSSAARELGDDLRDALTKIREKKLDAEQMEKRLSKRAADAASWDEAVQIYLGLSAVSAGKVSPKTNDLLKTMSEKLGFPQGYNSPREFVPGRMHRE